MTSTSGRKDEHLAVVLDEDVASTVSTGFERWRPRHRALPGIDLADVELGTEAFGRPIDAPLLVSCMTGGSEGTLRVNRNLAKAAEEAKIALGLGSLRAALEDPAQLAGFALRDIAPSIPILANVGVVGADVDDVVVACRSLDVDALVVHLNPLQEALQQDGTPAFRTALDTIRAFVAASPLPVVVKEVGFGLSADDVAVLLEAGCAAVDVAGAGGTNWALVEGHRSGGRPSVSGAFSGWGVPTAEALIAADAVRQADAPGARVIASGGITDGVTVLLALCLGADLVGIGGAWIRAATESAPSVLAAIRTVADQLRVAAFATGAARLSDLDHGRIELVGL